MMLCEGNLVNILYYEGKIWLLKLIDFIDIILSCCEVIIIFWKGRFIKLNCILDIVMILKIVIN